MRQLDRHTDDMPNARSKTETSLCSVSIESHRTLQECKNVIGRVEENNAVKEMPSSFY